MFYKTFFALTFLMANLFAFDPSVEGSSTMTGSIMNVVLNQEDSIANLFGDRLYLKPENLFHSKHGYILKNQQSAIVLPRLSFDENGNPYLLRRSPDDFELTCSNPKCGRVFFFTDTWNGNCPVCHSIGY